MCKTQCRLGLELFWTDNLVDSSLECYLATIQLIDYLQKHSIFHTISSLTRVGKFRSCFINHKNNLRNIFKRTVTDAEDTKDGWIEPNVLFFHKPHTDVQEHISDSLFSAFLIIGWDGEGSGREWNWICLTHWGRYKMATIFQCIFLN